MSSFPDGITLLEQLILANESLKVEDHSVITNVCTGIRISSEAGDINEYFRRQVELEASVVYLSSKYGALLDRWRRLLDKHKAIQSVELGARNTEGLKWSKGSKEEWFLSMDPKYVVLKDQMHTVEKLFFTIRDLYTIVFDRNKKLEQLSINYRRETEIDKRHS